MFCKECGAELKEGERFCMNCGMAVQHQDEKIEQPVMTQEIENQLNIDKNTKKSKRNLIIMTVILVTVMGVFIGGMIWHFSSPVYTIQKHIKEDKIAQVVKEYNRNVDDNWLWEILTTSTLKNHIKSQVDEYKKDELEYDELKSILNAYTEIDNKEISEIAKEYAQNIEEYQKTQEIFQSAEEFVAAKQYDVAIDKYEEILENEDFGAKAKEKLEAVKIAYKESVLEKTSSLTTISEYEDAIRVLETAIDTLKKEDELVQRLEEINASYDALIKKEALDNATTAIEKENYKGAFGILNDAIAKLPDDEELNNMMASVVKTYEEKIVSTVDNYVAEKKYDEALSALNVALSTLPQNETFNKKLEEVKALKPVSLTTLTPINGGFDWNEGMATDPFGNTYNNVNNYIVLDGYDYAEYRLYEKYNWLNFSAIGQEDIGEHSYGWVEIYADDELVFKSDAVRRKSDLKNYRINIAGVEYMKIIFRCEDVAWGDAVVLLMNFTLEK